MNSPLFGLLKIKMNLASQSAHSAHNINNLTSTNYCAELYPFLKWVDNSQNLILMIVSDWTAHKHELHDYKKLLNLMTEKKPG